MDDSLFSIRYGTESSAGTTQAAFTIGPVSFTTHELYTSFMSSVLLVPPIILITLLFAKAGSKPTKDEGSAQENTNNHNNNATACNKRPKGMWPHWCRYIAWVLTAITILVSAFFTILYSFEFGGEKSKAWLVTFFLSFFQSLILIQPLKVCLNEYTMFIC